MNDFHETRNSPAIKKNVDYEINDKWNYLEQTPDFRYSYPRYNRNDYDEYQDGKMYEKDIYATKEEDYSNDRSQYGKSRTFYDSSRQDLSGNRNPDTQSMSLQNFYLAPPRNVQPFERTTEEESPSMLENLRNNLPWPLNIVGKSHEKNLYPDSIQSILNFIDNELKQNPRTETRPLSLDGHYYNY